MNTTVHAACLSVCEHEHVVSPSPCMHVPLPMHATHFGLEQLGHHCAGQHCHGLAHLQRQLDGGEGRGNVLEAGWADDHWDHTHKQAGVEGNNEVHSWGRGRGGAAGKGVVNIV